MQPAPFKHRSTLLSSLTCCLAALLLYADTPACADLYTYTDAAGVLHITDCPADAHFQPTLTESQPAAATPAPAATVLPRSPTGARFVGCVGIICGFNNRIRCYSVFEKGGA